MINYFIYRISTDYDGFLPSKIPVRAKNGRFIFNWRAYFDSVDKGDIIIVYFQGSKCKKGIYSICRIKNYIYNKDGNKVVGKIIVSSHDNIKPLVDYSSGEELLKELFSSRKRGAEIIIPDQKEREIYNLLSLNSEIISQCKKEEIFLPGSAGYKRFNVDEIPLIKKWQIGQKVLKRDVISAYWIRPRQASWIGNGAPEWVRKITSAFEKFKAGDLVSVNEFGDSIYEQMFTIWGRKFNDIGAITAVPLNDYKKKHGEIDRVGELARVVSDRTGIPFKTFFSLKGDLSRRLYKRSGFTPTQFEKAYLSNLNIINISYLKDIIRTGKRLILLDDVYTDGVTTKTIIKALHDKLQSNELKISVVTLGIMLKKNNLSEKFIERFQ